MTLEKVEPAPKPVAPCRFKEFERGEHAPTVEVIGVDMANVKGRVFEVNLWKNYVFHAKTAFQLVFGSHIDGTARTFNLRCGDTIKGLSAEEFDEAHRQQNRRIEQLFSFKPYDEVVLGKGRLQFDAELEMRRQMAEAAQLAVMPSVVQIEKLEPDEPGHAPVTWVEKAAQTDRDAAHLMVTRSGLTEFGRQKVIDRLISNASCLRWNDYCDLLRKLTPKDADRLRRAYFYETGPSTLRQRAMIKPRQLGGLMSAKDAVAKFVRPTADDQTDPFDY